MPDAESVATECLQAWTTGDFETAGSLIEEDIGFVGPFGAAERADAYLSGLRRFRARGVQGVDMHRVFSDGDDVCIIYDLVTTMAAGTIPSAGWYRLRDGKIASVRAFFDARLLVPSPTPQSANAVRDPAPVAADRASAKLVQPTAGASKCRGLSLTSHRLHTGPPCSVHLCQA
jgi:ketosteroid isomerase-like protein